MVVAALGDLLGPKGLLVNFVVRNVKKMVPAYDLPNAQRFNAMIAEGERGTLRAADVGHEDIAFLQYTGGTTGVSKGAMLVHRNILANLEQSAAWLTPFLGEAAPDHHHGAAPVSHLLAHRELPVHDQARRMQHPDHQSA